MDWTAIQVKIMLFIGNGRGENDQTSNDEFRLIVIVEFVIKMDCPYAVNELILVLELVASEFENEISLTESPWRDKREIFYQSKTDIAPHAPTVRLPRNRRNKNQSKLGYRAVSAMGGDRGRARTRLGDRSAIGVLRGINQGNKCRAYDDAARFHFMEVPGRIKGCR
ncbi:hypothetical protein K2173_010146 (mitochondrion) [Erythroxylum novogranatense]|uniref:Uncharacterized protein n=1 Tax=Erythroxylum novogranatense TaxID=1862640 RepID=A0AAV8S3W3_9ROSI|nr:hypothetical protein K2173_010146 [Erythroxylum novogranatense]